MVKEWKLNKIKGWKRCNHKNLNFKIKKVENSLDQVISQGLHYINEGHLNKKYVIMMKNHFPYKKQFYQSNHQYHNQEFMLLQLKKEVIVEEE